MNYIANSRHRRFRHTVNILVNRIGFNILHLGVSERITALGVFVALAGCLFPWFSLATDGNADTSDTLTSFWAFSLSCGYVGYAIVAVLIVLIFLLISKRHKERLKTHIHIPIQDHTLIAFAGILIFVLGVVVFNMIRSYSMFFVQVRLDSGSAVACTGGLIVFLGGVLAYREERQELLRRIYIENNQSADSALQEYRDILDRKGKSENMKLPI